MSHYKVDPQTRNGTNWQLFMAISTEQLKLCARSIHTVSTRKYERGQKSLLIKCTQIPTLLKNSVDVALRFQQI